MDQNFLSENVDHQAGDASNKSDSLDNSMDKRDLSENVDLETNNGSSETDTSDNSMNQKAFFEKVDLESGDGSSGTLTLDNSMDEKSLSDSADLQLMGIKAESDAVLTEAVSDVRMGKTEQSNSSNNEVTECAAKEEECEEIDVVNVNSPNVEKHSPSMNFETQVIVSDINEVELINESLDQKELNLNNTESTVMDSLKDKETENISEAELSPCKNNYDIMEGIESKGKSDVPCVITSKTDEIKSDSKTANVKLCSDDNILMKQTSNINTDVTVNEKPPIKIDIPSKDISLKQKELDFVASDTSPMFTDDDDSQTSPKAGMLEVLLEEDEIDFETVNSDSVSSEFSKEVDSEDKTAKESVSTESSKEVSAEIKAEKEHVFTESSKEVSAEIKAEKEHVFTESLEEINSVIKIKDGLNDKKADTMKNESGTRIQGVSEVEKDLGRAKKQSLPKSFIEEFLSFSQGDVDSTNRTSTNESQKTSPLNRFPKIVKNVTTAEYPLLQELYKLMYLRNPWDTKEILAQRILEFSGFTFKQDSEDYYTREVILRTMPERNLEAIGTLLCIENIKSLASNMSTSRHILVSRVMEFLSKPRRIRKTRPVVTISNKQYRPRYPGPKCSKVKENVLKLDNEELEQLKEKILNGTSPQPQVLLKRIDLSVFCNFFAGGQAKSLHIESQDNPNLEEKEDEVQSEQNVDCLTEPPKKKLKDFPKIVKAIEIFSEEMLLDIHFLLYSKGAEIKDLKVNILEFTGFPFKSDADEYEEKREFLDKMNMDIVLNISKLFCLPYKKVKSSLINQILLFLQTLCEPSQEKKDKTSVKRKSRKLKNITDENISDSDESITCEVVSKEVEVIDLISSGEESGKEDSKNNANLKEKRTLANFETITKIVNTHPTEYLVDIFNLLYMKPYEPSTLREDILSFSGFKFDKSSVEYIKRKQFMDRMQYNSVRRVYNTLIHNSTEVKVFSKPVMNAEIFEFLFNLPETDTSVRMPSGVTAKPAVLTLPQETPLTNPTIQGILKGCHPFQNQTQTKLSDLKRVFQRVACFPCEYLVDVHKLLFMKDCEMKDIRQNIFNFKGFDFKQNSPEFKQRKMYLEYLTFHSLRKISSVLTTRTVDLRNSTKHELANHLTQVLAEYTKILNESKEPAIKEADKAVEAAPGKISIKENPVSKKEEKTEEEEHLGSLSLSKPKSTVENAIEKKQKNSCGNDALDLRVISSSSALEIKIQSVPESKNDSKQVKLPESKVIASGSKEKKIMISPKLQIPKVSYSKKSKTKYYSSSKGNVGSIPVTMLDSCRNYTEAADQELQQNYSQPSTPLRTVPRARIIPVVHNLPSPVNKVPNPKNNVFPDIRSNPEQVYQDYPTEDFGNYTVSLPVECILTEDSDNEPKAKKSKLMLQSKSQLHQRNLKTASNLILPELSPQERVESVPQHSASFQMKIRNAMTKASEDEEDCDKPLAALVGHPNDKILKQQICEIVEKTDLQEITINGVIQKIFALYPQFNLNYRKEFIKSTLRSLLYRLGEQDDLDMTTSVSDKPVVYSPDCSVSTTDPLENAIPPISPKLRPSNIVPVSVSDFPNAVVLNKQHQES